MNRLKNVRDSWKAVTECLMSDKQEFAQFLRFASRMYKQSFSDAALIYNQNPNATKVATLETWNKLGRVVNRGEHSIVINTGMSDLQTLKTAFHKSAHALLHDPEKENSYRESAP